MRTPKDRQEIFQGPENAVAAALHSVASHIGNQRMTGIPDLMRAVRTIDPGFSLPSYLHVFETQAQPTIDLRAFSDIEELVNEQVLIPRGLFLYHLSFGPGQNKPEFFAGRVVKVEVYKTLSTGEEIKIIEPEFSSGSTLALEAGGIMGLSRGLCGLVKREVFGTVGSKRLRRYSSSDENSYAALIGTQVEGRNLAAHDFELSQYWRSWFEEGEHAVGHALERRQRQLTGSAHGLELFIQPAYHALLRAEEERMWPILAAAGYQELPDREGVLEEENMILSLAANEIMSGIRSTILAMDRLIAQGDFKAASLNFWYFLEECLEGREEMEYLQRSGARQLRIHGTKSDSEVALQVVNAIGGSVIMRMLPQQFRPEVVKQMMARGKKFPKFGENAAHEQLEVLRDIASQLLVQADS